MLAAAQVRTSGSCSPAPWDWQEEVDWLLAELERVGAPSSPTRYSACRWPAPPNNSPRAAPLAASCSATHAP